MTTTKTLDTEATVEQCIRIIDAGADYVRITAPGIKEAENLKNINEELNRRGYDNPLIADIHFNPKAAEIAAHYVEKIRINPGNYTDKKRFVQLQYTDDEYLAEIDRIRERFVPLLHLCKKEGTAIRIGTNHGSLSDRIMSRYGDTSLGMVESAMEFLRICVSESFFDIVLSMKSSNTRVMIQAHRLLVHKMQQENMDFPIHLGVTEAGEGDEGRIKSAVGIGSLLSDGIGDTIRVSLSEEPEMEIPVAASLVDYFAGRQQHQVIDYEGENLINPFEYHKRETKKIANIGGTNVPVVVCDLSNKEELTTEDLNQFIEALKPDYIFCGKQYPKTKIDYKTTVIINAENWRSGVERCYPLFTLNQFLTDVEKSDEVNFVLCHVGQMSELRSLFSEKKHKYALVIETNNANGVAEQRAFFNELMRLKCDVPVIIRRIYEENSIESLQVKASCDFGTLFCDGLGDGILISNIGNIGASEVNGLSFGILQATGSRISKTEYISCPTCGRTLFALEKINREVKSRTSQLKGLKIAVMGCVVNGPGEMADANYGCIISGPDRFSVYKGKEVIKKNVHKDSIVEELIETIKEFGDWQEEKS